jgi:hypothetical protein
MEILERVIIPGALVARKDDPREERTFNVIDMGGFLPLPPVFI